MNEEQYWADGATKNCVWLFQVRYERYEECTCGAERDDDGELMEGQRCSCESFIYWETERVFLTREEANAHGEARPYAWGNKGEGWRIYGVMCEGLMAEILGKHNKEFEDKVEYINN